MGKGEQTKKHMILTNQYALTYKDDTGDIINVSDDEDLHAAYEVAEDALEGQLKLEIKERLNENVADDVPVDVEMIKPKFVKKTKIQEKPAEEEMQINSCTVKAAISEVVGANYEGKEDDSSDGSSSDEEFERKRKHRKHSHHKKNKNCDKFDGLPRKAFKRLIKKELDKQCETIFDNLFNSSESDSP